MYVEPEYLLNERITSEMSIADAVHSPEPNHEVPVHIFEFDVPEECDAFLNIHAPLVTYHYIQTLSPEKGQPITFPFHNAACRAYLNGTGFNLTATSKQWNSPGGALVGGGQWNFGWAAPVNGLLEGLQMIHLQAGTNTLRIHLATNSVNEYIRLMGPRWFQVFRLKVSGSI